VEGQQLSHYTIVSKIGEGGMGAVYRAIDSRLNRTVAIKVLPPAAGADPDRQRRFVQEAQSASALNHPNIVHIYDIDTAGEVTFIAMEFVDGRPLDALIDESPVPMPLALEYEAVLPAHAAQLAMAVSDATAIVDYLCAVGRQQAIHFLWRPALSDPVDEFVLELAVAAQCQAIVTHNVRDFASARTFGVQILTPGDFLRVIEEREERP